jgi:hypothetical protein
VTRCDPGICIGKNISMTSWKVDGHNDTRMCWVGVGPRWVKLWTS